MNSVSIISVSEDEGGVRLDRWFKRHYPELSHARLEKLLRTGQVRVNGARAKSNTRLSAGQAIRIPPLGKRRRVHARSKPTLKVTEKDIEGLKDAVLYIDQHLLVINKPAGFAVQGGSNVSKHLDAMLDVLCFDASERPRLVHRLDKDTSGVLILARNRKSASMLSVSFRSKEARKVYWAIVAGVPRPTSGSINSFLAKRSSVRGDKVMVDNKGKQAITSYRVIENAGRKAAWLSLEPFTGRTHQLRVHCNELGTPILGDGKYGGSCAFFEGGINASRQLQLHAKAIRIPNPGGGILEVTAPLPDHMAQTWRFLGFDEHRESDLFMGDRIC